MNSDIKKKHQFFNVSGRKHIFIYLILQMRFYFYLKTTHLYLFEKRNVFFTVYIFYIIDLLARNVPLYVCSDY